MKHIHTKFGVGTWCVDSYSFNVNFIHRYIHLNISYYDAHFVHKFLPKFKFLVPLESNPIKYRSSGWHP